MTKIRFRVNILLFLVFVTVLSLLVVNLRLSTSSPSSLYSESNAPEFYGLTKAVIKVGDEFSLSDARFRIFARDFEDGDLTGKIVANSNVNTSSVGIYSISYEIVDSHGNTTSLVVPIEVVDDESINRYYERTLYSLPSVWNMDLAGTNRGNYHDRQMLGFYMEAGSKVNIKKISGTGNLSLTYLNNDSHTEKNFSIGEEYTTVTNSYSGVPFIKTKYSEKYDVIIGIEVIDENGVEELPYYHYGDDEEEFFREWNANISSYSVIESEDVSVLVPYEDRDLLLKDTVGSFKSLSEFMNFWDKVVNKYDAYLGLSYDPEEAIDQNVKTKYFVKANIHGAGLAYYGGDHVGYNSSSVAGFFNMGWAGLHELGHGYQGSLAHSVIEQGEVSNNILGHYVQMDKSFYTASDDWLGSISNIEERYATLRKEGKTYSDYDAYGYKGQLYILVNLLDTYNPEETYAKINRLWRRSLLDGTKLTAPDAYVLAFYELYGVNASYYFESWGIEVSNDVKEIVSNSKVLYLLGDVVNDNILAENIKTSLNKNGIYSLVTVDELKPYNLVGNARVTLNIDDISELLGKRLIISGNGVKKEIIIESNEVYIEGLNVGAYELVVPTPKNNIYSFESNVYLRIENGRTTEQVIDFRAYETETLDFDEVFYFKGLGNWTFATLRFENANMAILKTNSGAPHSYFTDSYVNIKITNTNGEVVYEKDYIGNVSSIQEEMRIAVSLGYKITIMHREAHTRLEVRSTHLNLENSFLSKPSTVTTTYVVGEYGIYLEGDTNDQYELYKNKVDKYAEKLANTLTEEEVSNKNLKSVEKRVLFTSIKLLREPDTSAYLKKYNYLYNGGKPELNVNYLTVNQYDNVNLYTVFSGVDNEDGVYVLTDENFIHGPIDTSRSGVFEISYILIDTDGNETNGSIILSVNPVVEDTPKDEEILECPDVEVKEDINVVTSGSTNSGKSESANRNDNVGSNLENKNEGTNIDTDNSDDEVIEDVPKEDDENSSTDAEEESTASNKDNGSEILIDIYVLLFTLFILIIIYLRAKRKAKEQN